MAKSKLLNYKSSKIHYLEFGKVQKIMFAFHGFSENAQSFLCLAPSLTQNYTVLAIDLPFHGHTHWNELNAFTKEDLVQIVILLIEHYQIKRFSVLGFSLGGKCALVVAKNFAHQLDNLLLMAGDGIQTNKIYNLAVYPKWGRNLFKLTVNNPSWFLVGIKFLKTIKILSPWLYKFTENHMATKQKRERLYNTWISMAAFNPDIVKVKRQLITYNCKTYLFFGKRDEVVSPQVAAYFSEGLTHCNITILERGHYFIDDQLNHFIEEAFAS